MSQSTEGKVNLQNVDVAFESVMVSIKLFFKVLIILHLGLGIRTITGVFVSVQGSETEI